MAALLAAVVLLFFALGYRYYGRFVGRRIYEDHLPTQMPAHTKRDGVDFVPTSRGVLFGHHFTSVAGAAPIIGPCVAAYWGWLPAVLWIVIGTLTMGAVHDFGALVLSVREGGRSIADLAGGILGHRPRLMLQVFVLVLVWLVLAVFAMAIAGLFVSQPTAVLPVNVGIVLAVIVGFLLYRLKLPPLIPSLIALFLLYGSVLAGTKLPLDLQSLGLVRAQAEGVWIVGLLVYSGIASLLPVWLLLQPRDYINSHQLLVGLGLLFLGLFVAHPSIDAPALRSGIGLGSDSSGAPPMIPMLFVTVACGAISGFHGLVASGTTSKQLSSMADARSIGYGSMVGEGALALASLLAAVAGIGLVGSCALPAQGEVAQLSWSVYYDAWSHAGANKASAFVLGGGAFLESLGMSQSLARTLMAVLVISFAATSLDTACRVQRFVLQEIGESHGAFRALRNRYLATLLAITPALFLAFGSAQDPTTGATKKVGWLLWPIFGASNQMLAACTLLLLTLYFGARRKPILVLFVPMVFVMLATFLALLLRLRLFLSNGNVILASLSALLLALVLWMIFEASMVWHRSQGRLER